MRKDGNTIHDLVDLAEGFINCLLNARNESCSCRNTIHDSSKRKADNVTRDEFNAAFTMLAKFRTTQEEIKERLAALEAKLNLSRRNKRKSGAKLFLQNIKQNKQSKRRA